MMANSLITQVVVAGIAIGIIVTYIQPSIAEVGNIQDKIERTNEELDKVNSVNSKLEQLVAQAGAISQQNKSLLSIYLPEVIDEVAVLKDLEAITERAGVIINSLDYEGMGKATVSASEGEVSTDMLPISHNFSLVVSCSYEQIKLLLLLLEKNNYPLDVQTLSLKPTEGGLLNVDLDITTYSHK